MEKQMEDQENAPPSEREAPRISEDDPYYGIIAPVPGKPCENPEENGWNLSQGKDVRDDFSKLLSYEAETFLLKNTESFYRK